MMNYLGNAILSIRYETNNNCKGHIYCDFSKVRTEKERQTIYRRLERKILNKKGLFIISIEWKEVNEEND